MVSLDGAPKEYRFADADRIAARVASTLIRAGVATPEHWATTKRDPIAFVQTAIERCVAKHQGAVLEENFYLGLTLSSSVDPLSNEEELGDALYLIAEPTEAGYLVLGETLRILEQEDPRLPVTFYRLFHRVSFAIIASAPNNLTWNGMASNNRNTCQPFSCRFFDSSDSC